jgi:hypothetical protein
MLPVIRTAKAKKKEQCEREAKKEGQMSLFEDTNPKKLSDLLGNL